MASVLKVPDSPRRPTPSTARSRSARRHHHPRVKKLNLGFPPADLRDDINKLMDDVDKENRDRFRTKWGFDISKGEPVPGSKWKWTQLN